MPKLEKPRFNIDDYAYIIGLDSENKPVIFCGRIIMIKRLNEISFVYWIKGDTFETRHRLETEVFASVEELLENFKEVIYK